MFCKQYYVEFLSFGDEKVPQFMKECYVTLQKNEESSRIILKNKKSFSLKVDGV